MPGNPKKRVKQNRRRRKLGRSLVNAVPGTAGAGGSLGGTALAGPFGGLVGVASSEGSKRFLALTGLDNAFKEISERFGQREQERAQFAFDRAINGIATRLEAGEQLRTDGFFERRNDEGEPSDAEEILEGVLRLARDEHENRKAERLGALYEFLAFDSEITPAHASYLIRLAGELTYQQLLLLGAFASEVDWPDWRPTGAFHRREVGLVMAIYDLGRRGLLVRSDNAVISSWADIDPSLLRTVLDGKTLVEAMNLKEAEERDWEELLISPAQHLGVIIAQEDKTRASIEMVVPPGSPPEIQRVQLSHRLMEFVDKENASS